MLDLKKNRIYLESVFAGILHNLLQCDSVSKNWNTVNNFVQPFELTSSNNQELVCFCDRAQTECHSLTGNIEIAQNVLQGLIFGSGLNWAEDKKLCDLVLSLGQPVEELLKEPVAESETLTDEEQPSQLC